MKYSLSLQTIAWLNARRLDESLVISPKFQRRAVWLEAERSSLMETIMNGLPFPEIYIHHLIDPESGKEQHIVVDGQQRVTSVLMFINNEVSLPINDEWQGQYFRDFDVVQRGQFWDYQIVVRGLSQTNDAEIRDLFGRLNTNNVRLNDQELRNSIFRGRFKQLSERMADNPGFLNIGLFTARDMRRMIDVEFASELLLLHVEGVTNKKDLLDEAYGRFEEEFPREADYESEFNATLNLLLSLLNPSNKSSISTRSNFYSLYGACLRYYRETGNRTFRNPQNVCAALSELFHKVKAHETANWHEAEQYFEAVSRAASDRGRRFAREEILYHLLKSSDEISGRDTSTSSGLGR